MRRSSHAPFIGSIVIAVALCCSIACSNKSEGGGTGNDTGPEPSETTTPPEDSSDTAATDTPSLDVPTDSPTPTDSTEPLDVPASDATAPTEDTAPIADATPTEDTASPSDTTPEQDAAGPSDAAITIDAAPVPDAITPPPDAAPVDMGGGDTGSSNPCDGLMPPAGTPASAIGCSDSTREGFLDGGKYPKIAACGGAWDVGGIHTVTPACNREAGNTGLNPNGAGCNVSDLCAEGWHVCYGKVDVLDRNPLGCGGIMECAQSPAFFLARTSSVGAFNCSQDSTKFGGPGTSNDLFGCGDLGCHTKLGKCGGGSNCDPLNDCKDCLPGMSCQDQTDCSPQSCFPLTLGSHDLCKTLKVMGNCNCDFLPDDPATPKDESLEVKCLPSSGGCGWCKPLNYWNLKLGLSLQNNWNCGSSTTNEANNVKKTDPNTQGGVLCCMDVVAP